MAFEIKSVKVPRSRDRVEITFRQPRNDESVEEYKVKLPEAPAPGFVKALASLEKLVISACNIEDPPGDLFITGITFKDSDLGLMVAFNAEVRSANDVGPDWEIKVEPILIQRMTDAEGKSITKIVTETRKYLKGFRSQANLFQGNEPEKNKDIAGAVVDTTGGSKHTVKIDMEKKCERCDDGGATENGFCLTCTNLFLKTGSARFDDPVEAVQQAIIAWREAQESAGEIPE